VKSGKAMQAEAGGDRGDEGAAFSRYRLSRRTPLFCYPETVSGKGLTRAIELFKYQINILFLFIAIPS